MRPETDVIVVLEYTEGFYADRNTLDRNGEFRPDRDTVLSVRVITRRACLRVAHQVFCLASALGRGLHCANPVAGILSAGLLLGGWRARMTRVRRPPTPCHRRS